MSMQQVDKVPPRHFRDVLGQLPTGIVAVTSRSTDDGAPIGMTLGSFTSVSLDPPLVAFLPDHSSSTFPRIREAGTFCANILKSDQKSVSQAFATKGPDRFVGVDWRPAPQTGSPVIEGSLAWIDCEIVEIHEAGDHDIVIARVLELETGEQGFPLVFFQGGYGTFTLRSLVLATRGALNESVRIAETLRTDLEQLSADFDLECRVFAREKDELVVVMTTGYNGPADRVGVVVPFCPPFGMSFAAWGTREVRDAWYDSASGQLTAEQRAGLDGELNRVEERGWSISFANGPLNTVGRVIEDIAEVGSTPALERKLLEAGRELTADLGNVPELDAANVDTVRSISVPVLRGDGVPVLHLVARGLSTGADAESVECIRDRLIDIAKGKPDMEGRSS
jgi:flavin reductase (DIM6/NTAB) family NADH-FMN oxidoreductase RutF